MLNRLCAKKIASVAYGAFTTGLVISSVATICYSIVNSFNGNTEFTTTLLEECYKIPHTCSIEYSWIHTPRHCYCSNLTSAFCANCAFAENLAHAAYDLTIVKFMATTFSIGAAFGGIVTGIKEFLCSSPSATEDYNENENESEYTQLEVKEEKTSALATNSIFKANENSDRESSFIFSPNQAASNSNR